MKYQSLKEIAFEANMQIPARNLAIYTWGNVSAFDRYAAVFAIKPSGVPYDRLKIDDIVVVDLDCKVVEGKLNPSSDTPTHAVLYKAFGTAGVNGITHTHSTFATAWAQACKPIPLFGTTHADHSPNAIPCTPYLTKEAVQRNYEYETGKLIVDTFKNINPIENPMILVAGHGPFAWGESADKSVYNAAVLEEVAKMAYLTLGINPLSATLPDYITEKHYLRKHGKNAYYGQKI